MTRPTLSIIALLTLAAMASRASAESAAIEQLAWMSGHWASQNGERWTEEHWLEPRGGMILGVNRSGNAISARAYEFLRIQTATIGQAQSQIPRPMHPPRNGFCS